MGLYYKKKHMTVVTIFPEGQTTLKIKIFHLKIKREKNTIKNRVSYFTI